MIGHVRCGEKETLLPELHRYGHHTPTQNTPHNTFTTIHNNNMNQSQNYFKTQSESEKNQGVKLNQHLSLW